MSEPRRDSKWWGWGDPAVAPALDDEALGVLRERIGELEPWPLAAELEDFELPRPQPLPASLIEAVGADNVFTSTEDRLRHASGRGYADLARMRQRRARGRARRGRDAARRRGPAPRPRRLRRARASPSSPSAAAPASSAGSSRCAAPTARLISLDLAALRDVEVDRRSLTARLGAGLRGPEAEAALGRAGPHPRPLPAVLRVRDDRRLRRDPLGRPGLERLRPLRRPRQLGAPASPRPATWRRWRRRTRPPVRRCASSSSAPRACWA